MPPFAFAAARFLAAHLPATIHPMILHFPIVFLYVAAPLEVAALIWPGDGLLPRAAFWTLTAACVAIIVTMTAGFISEQVVQWTATTQVLLERHQRFAILTGAAAGAAWLTHIVRRFPDGQPWGLWGRGQGGVLSAVLVVLAAICVTVTGRIGGEMVYHYGVGVLGVTRHVGG